MSERAVRVLFTPESRRGDGPRHSNAATNERTGTTTRKGSRAPRDLLRGEAGLIARLRHRLPADNRIKRARTMFAVLADEQRLRIIVALSAAGELSVGEVADVLGSSVSVASHHLRRMRDLGVLEDRSAGKLAYYSVAAKAVARLAATVIGTTSGRAD